MRATDQEPAQSSCRPYLSTSDAQSPPLRVLSPLASIALPFLPNALPSLNLSRLGRFETNHLRRLANPAGCLSKASDWPGTIACIAT